MVKIGIKLINTAIKPEVINKIKEYNKTWVFSTEEEYVLSCDYFNDKNGIGIKKVIELYEYLISQNVKCELYQLGYVTNLDSLKQKKEFEELKFKAQKAISEYSSPERIKKIEESMNALYDFVSKYELMDLFQRYLQRGIDELELELSYELLELNSEPEYDSRNIITYPKSLDTEEDAERAIRYIVWDTRNFLCRCDKNNREDPYWNNFLRHTILNGKCDSSCDYLEKICYSHRIDYIRFAVDRNLNKGMFHHFDIVKINNKFYLVDCTYRQFFTKSRMFLKRIPAVRSERKGSNIGTYMIMTAERKRIAEQLLKYGYIEATATNLKTYFDAIIFSGRDGNFYKENGLDYMNPDDCIPKYSITDYFDILKRNGVISSSYEIGKATGNEELSF